MRPVLRALTMCGSNLALQDYTQCSAEFSPQKLTMPLGLAVSGKDAVVLPQTVVLLTSSS